MLHELKVENIKCAGCVHSIKQGLEKISGVKNVWVDVDQGLIRVETGGEIRRETLIKKLHQMGYAEPGKGSVLTKATSYVSCMIGRVTS